MHTEIAKVIFGLLLFAASFASAKSLQLELFAQTTLVGNSQEDPKAFGGLSGMFWDGHKIVAISDDRGKFGLPRFYEFDLKITSGQVESKVIKVRHFQNTPKDWILDPEGVAQLPGGQFLVSSEGDLNRKPRSLPQVFLTSSLGEYQSAVILPDKFLPERAGLQKKGIENNRGFEGLTVGKDGQDLFILNEYPIISDQGDDDQNYWLRLVTFKKTKAGFKVSAEYPYQVMRKANSEFGVEVFRGVSEILEAGVDRLLVLERGARLSKSGISYSGGLYLTTLAGAMDVSKRPSLADGLIPAMKKELLVDFEELFKNKKIENFEALTWGPVLPDGRKTLLVLSDNNFSAKEKSTLLVFAVKEVE